MQNETTEQTIKNQNDLFYSEKNMQYLKYVIDGIEKGERPLVEHELIDNNEE